MRTTPVEHGFAGAAVLVHPLPLAVAPDDPDRGRSSPGRPNSGVPQVSRESLVCSGPWMASQSGNVMFMLSLHHDDLASRLGAVLDAVLRASLVGGVVEGQRVERLVVREVQIVEEAVAPQRRHDRAPDAARHAGRADAERARAHLSITVASGVAVSHCAAPLAGSSSIENFASGAPATVRQRRAAPGVLRVHRVGLAVGTGRRRAGLPVVVVARQLVEVVLDAGLGGRVRLLAVL